MSKIKKAACLLLVAAMVWVGFGITSVSISVYADAGMGCLHANGVRTEGVYLYTTTVEAGFASDEGNYFICTERRNVNRLDKICVDCGRKLGDKIGYHILSHSNSRCTWTDVAE